MIRLVLHCEDRMGLTQEVLAELLNLNFDLRGIELGENQLFVKLTDKSLGVHQPAIENLLQIDGINAVESVSLLPSEREHLELETLLSFFPDAVISTDLKGRVITANPAFYQLFQLSPGTPINLASILSKPDFDLLIEKINAGKREQLSLVIAEKSLLIELCPVSGEGNEAHSNVVLQIKNAAQIAAQLEMWQRSHNLRFEEVIVQDQAMQQVVNHAQKVAVLDAPLLIEGETGTGKEVFARACHFLRTPEQPFMALNCAALPDNVAEHELFGYAANAFEGALASGKPGLLELCDGGTLYFDEIGEMSPYLQVKLLRFLEHGTFRRVGTDNEVSANVRVIASTQKNLTELTQQGKFRDDLYYRLNVLNLSLPPLRKRKCDIGPLANYFIQTACDRLSRSKCELTQRALLALKRYNWPGNIRELENIIFRAVSITTGHQITTRILNMPMLKGSLAGLALDEAIDDHKSIMLDFERQLFEYLYPLYPSSRKLASKLGLSHTAVANKLKQFGIN